MKKDDDLKNGVIREFNNKLKEIQWKEDLKFLKLFCSISVVSIFVQIVLGACLGKQTIPSLAGGILGYVSVGLVFTIYFKSTKGSITGHDYFNSVKRELENTKYIEYKTISYELSQLIRNLEYKYSDVSYVDMYDINNFNFIESTKYKELLINIDSLEKAELTNKVDLLKDSYDKFNISKSIKKEDLKIKGAF